MPLKIHGFILLAGLLVSCTRITLDDDYWRKTYPQYQYVKIGGIDTRYRIVGNGPPLVLIPGLGATYDIFDGVVPALMEHYRLYLLDLRGMGYSAKPTGLDYGFSSQVIHVQEFLRHFEIKNAAIWGHSIGAVIALHVALYSPQHISCVVLSDIPYGVKKFPNRNHTLLNSSFGKLAELYTMKKPYREILNDIYYDHEKFVTPERINTWHEVGTRRGGISAMRSFLHSISFAEVAKLEENYRQLKNPVLLLWGEHDKWFSVESGKKLAAVLSKAEFQILPGAGHQSMEENPEESAEAVRRFLQKNHSEKKP